MYQTIQEAELYDLNKSLIPNKIQALEVVRARDDVYKGLLIVSPIIKEGSVYKNPSLFLILSKQFVKQKSKFKYCPIHFIPFWLQVV